MNLEGTMKLSLSVFLSVLLSVNSLYENGHSSFSIYLMTGFLFSRKFWWAEFLANMTKNGPKKCFLYFLTLHVLLFAICTIFNPMYTRTLYLLYLSLYIIFFAFFNTNPLYLKSAILILTMWNLVQI